MLVPAVFFWQIVLAVHVVFVVAAFGLLLSYPLITIAAERIDRRSAARDPPRADAARP